jgi:hypothetical protein
MAGAPVPIPGTDGGPVLTIPSLTGAPEILSGAAWMGPVNDWQPNPSNVLVLPQQTPPTGPIVPNTAQGSAQQYLTKCCADENGVVNLLAHDSSTGWWFIVESFDGTGCDAENGDGTCGVDNGEGGFNECPILPLTSQDCVGLPAISYEHYAQLIMANADGCYTEGGPLLAQTDFIDQLPAWAIPKNWAGEFNFDAWTLACNDTAIQIQTGQTPCVLPPWLSCAPSLITSAYCYLLNWIEESCNPTNVARCTALLLAGTLDEDIPSCLAELALTCTSAIVVQAINGLISWLQLNPFGCGTTTGAGQCVAPAHLPPCGPNECFSADGCCGPCDPPLPYNNAGPLIGGGLGGGMGGLNQDALPLIPTPLTIPLPTTAIAVTACKECESGEDESEIDETASALDA